MGSRLCLAAVFCLWVAGGAAAQQTGSVSGTVFDQSGAAVAGASVRISGDPMPAGRTTTTTDSGTYSFSLLLPGEYVVEAEKPQAGTTKRTVLVQVDRDTQLDLAIGVTVQEALVVTAVTPIVDMRSTEVSFNFKDEYLRNIPLERNYRGLFQLIPGVPDNRSPVGPAAGGTRQDNAYLIDGVNITNPGFGYLSTEVNELDIAEVNIKRAGVSAEFGRTAGAVTNAVTRSGTNQLSGAARIDWLPQELIGDLKDDAFPDPLLTTVVSPGVSLGGPVLRDKLFWYGSARYFGETRGDRVNKLNEVLPNQERTGHELYGKLTASWPRHLVNVGYRDRPNDVANASLTPDTAAGVATTTDNSSRVATATWGYFLTDRSSIEARYLYMKENNEDVPLTNLGYLPTWDPNNLSRMGLYQDPLQANVLTGGAEYTDTANYKRHEIRATYGHFLDFGKTQHEVKVGGGYEFGEEYLARLTNGWGSLVRITAAGQPLVRARYYFTQPAQRGQGRTWALFVQDNITIGSRLTVNAGLLVNRDDFVQDLEGSGGCPADVGLTGGAALFKSDGDRCTFLRFGYGDEIQPRVGVNYNVRQGKGDKFYVNWGRFYNMDQKSSGRSLAPRRIYQREARFDLSGNLISDVPRASTTGKLIDPDLEPIYNDEVLAGYATPIRGEWGLDVFYIYRNTNNFIEDVPSVLPDTGPYAAANLPCTRFDACRGAEGKRTYHAFTVELSRRLARKWSANVSYTWSRFEGNFDLDYSRDEAVFNTSSFIQDGPGTNVEEPNRFGPLHQDRPHVFKLFSSWVPTDTFTAGAYLRVQSGTPWNARAPDWEGAELNYLEPAGAHRNPVWTNLDLLASYRVRLSARAAVTLEARLLNVFGNQTRLSTDPQQFLDLNTIDGPPYFAPYVEPNPFFGTASQYAPPRRLVLGASTRF
jgi:hypothetical protein